MTTTTTTAAASVPDLSRRLWPTQAILPPPPMSNDPNLKPFYRWELSQYRLLDYSLLDINWDHELRTVTMNVTRKMKAAAAVAVDGEGKEEKKKKETKTNPKVRHTGKHRVDIKRSVLDVMYAAYMARPVSKINRVFHQLAHWPGATMDKCGVTSEEFTLLFDGLVKDHGVSGSEVALAAVWWLLDPPTSTSVL
jgi:hypothetical protein